MLIASRSFLLAKDPERSEEYQDALEIDGDRGIAVIADGVSSAIFSAQWARLLCAAVLAELPEPKDTESFARWLHERRQEWAGQIDVTGLAWFQKAKLPLGAFSTLLWVSVTPEGNSGEYSVICRAIGDSCLFHIRDGQLLRSFPIQTAAEMETNPVVLGSVDLNRDHLLQFSEYAATCPAGDLLVLCTDAVAQWALQNAEAGNPPVWERFWEMDGEAWRQEVLQCRTEGQMRVDDATLALLYIGGAPVRVGGEPVESDIYDLAEPPAREVAARPTTDDFATPVLVDDDAVTPVIVSDNEWTEKMRAASEQVTEGIDKVSDQIVRGIRGLWGKATEVYRDKIKDKLPKK